MLFLLKCEFVLEGTCKHISYGGRPVFPSFQVEHLDHQIQGDINKVKGIHRSVNDLLYDPTHLMVKVFQCFSHPQVFFNVCYKHSECP